MLVIHQIQHIILNLDLCMLKKNFHLKFRYNLEYFIDPNVMVQHVKMYLKQFNHLIRHLHERIVVIDGQMHIIIVIDHNIKMNQDIHLIGKNFDMSFV